ncbi:uncharacterized protein LOC124156209 [Ischnura elegans]|uniref:uncharacterized protein LOC124156209 n=1 Tax=Ischnura elegans TaxID=197161 RepID=UPI001ED8B987|nr:uncharacterized protein LOC124156209 [Ischnura elegans]
MAFSASVSVLVVLAVFSLANGSTLVRSPRDTPTPSLQELLESARTQLETVGQEVAKAVRGEEGAMTADDVKAVVEQRTQELTQRARAFSEEAARQLEVHREHMSEASVQALQQASAQVNASLEHVQTLARDSPSAVENFNQAFKSTVESLVEANSKLAKAAGDDVGEAHDQLAAMTRNTMSQAMDLMKNFAAQLSAAATSS